MCPPPFTLRGSVAIAVRAGYDANTISKCKAFEAELPPAPPGHLPFPSFIVFHGPQIVQR